MPYYSISTPSTGNATQLQSRPISTAAPAAGNSLVWDGSAWVPANGATGATGPAGADGAKVYHGAGAPSETFGNSGDLWVDTAGQRIYGPKANGAWGTPMNLAPGLPGPTGAAGAGSTGPTGAPGSQGQPGAAGASVTGATGARGVDGQVGSQGATGPTGAQGVDGAAGSPGASVTGPTGPVGPASSVTGPAGAPGAAGGSGSNGATGPTGAPGAAGSNGAASTVTGPTGATGAAGSGGPPSVTGVNLSATGVYNPLTLDGSYDIYYLTLATGAAIQSLNITGPTGTTKQFLNIGTTGSATFNHATGANANAQFAVPWAGSVVAPTGGGNVVAQYDGNRWRVI